MSSWMGDESDVNPLVNFDGAAVESAADEACAVSVQSDSDRVRIEITTGPGGSFVGSEILVNGKPVSPHTTEFEVGGAVGDRWQIISAQWAAPEVLSV